MKNPIKLYAMLTCLGMAGCAYGRVGPVLTFEDIAKMKNPESISPHYRAWVDKVMKLRAQMAGLIEAGKKGGAPAIQAKVEEAKKIAGDVAKLLYVTKKEGFADPKTTKTFMQLVKEYDLEQSVRGQEKKLEEEAEPIVTAIKKDIPLTPEQRAQAEKLFVDGSLIGNTLGVISPTDKATSSKLKEMLEKLKPAVSEEIKTEFQLMIAPPPATLMIAPPPAQSPRRGAAGRTTEPFGPEKSTCYKACEERFNRLYGKDTDEAKANIKSCWAACRGETEVVPQPTADKQEKTSKQEYDSALTLTFFEGAFGAGLKGKIVAAHSSFEFWNKEGWNKLDSHGRAVLLKEYNDLKDDADLKKIQDKKENERTLTENIWLDVFNKLQEKVKQFPPETQPTTNPKEESWLSWGQNWVYGWLPGRGSGISSLPMPKNATAPETKPAVTPDQPAPKSPEVQSEEEDTLSWWEWGQYKTGLLGLKGKIIDARDLIKRWNGMEQPSEAGKAPDINDMRKAYNTLKNDSEMQAILQKDPKNQTAQEQRWVRIFRSLEKIAA